MTAIERRTTSDHVSAEIRRQIWAGEIRSGEHLNQVDVAAALGVSRIPVREALITLAHEGTVRMAPHKGAYVELLTEQSVQDHYDLYGHIDGFALRRAIVRSVKADRLALAKLLHDAGRANNPDEMQSHMVNARATIHELGGSPRLRAVAGGLTGLIPGNFFVEVDGSVGVAQIHLPAVANAVETGNESSAVTAYETMMGEYGGLVTATLRRRDILVDPPRHDRSATTERASA